jgi:NADPH:quinone reductase-like Zn-dependent oxidoreductase
MRLMEQNRGVSGVHLAYLTSQLELLHQIAGELMRLYVEGAIKPHVEQVFRFDEVAEAHRMIEERRNSGKLLLKP